MTMGLSVAKAMGATIATRQSYKLGIFSLNYYCFKYVGIPPSAVLLCCGLAVDGWIGSKIIRTVQ